jgi:hypothetical protein
VVYQDGDEERRVNGELIRRTAGKAVDRPAKEVVPRPGPSPPFKVKDPAEARLLPKGDWFPCEVTAVNADGTYGVKTEDGTEGTVDRSRIRIYKSALLRAAEVGPRMKTTLRLSWG